MLHSHPPEIESYIYSNPFFSGRLNEINQIQECVTTIDGSHQGSNTLSASVAAMALVITSLPRSISMYLPFTRFGREKAACWAQLKGWVGVVLLPWQHTAAAAHFLYSCSCVGPRTPPMVGVPTLPHTPSIHLCFSDALSTRATPTMRSEGLQWKMVISHTHTFDILIV